MAFAESVKLEAKRRAAFRCCICHKPLVEVHHITPESEGGPDSLDNAAPLCASCHDLYGGNPEKRKQIRQMRDHWWQLMEKRSSALLQTFNLDNVAVIGEDQNASSGLRSGAVALYHFVFADETFRTSANHIYELVKWAQKEFPGIRRALFLDIEGHRNSENGFDHDMFELQSQFILGCLGPFLSEVHIPLVSATRKDLQRNDIPEKIIISSSGDNAFGTAGESNEISAMYIADVGKWFTSE